MSISQHPYFDFLIAKSSHSFMQGLDPVSQKLLEFIALEDFKGCNSTMMQALRFSNYFFLSENTLAKRIKQLQKMGLIEIQTDNTDRRVKFLYPSMKTSKYFNDLSEQIVKVKLANQSFFDHT